MGLTQFEMGNKEAGCINLSKSLELINNGYKSSDSYVEYFHEIYQAQIEKEIQTHCNNL